MKNLAGFTFPHPDAPKNRPVLHPILRRGYLRGVCNTPLHGYVQNLAGFIFPHTDTPKTHPILGANRRRGTFRGVCNTPLHGYVQNPPDFRPKSLAQDILGRMQYAPTRVPPKFGRFHISAHGCTKNAPDFTIPNRGAPKTYPVLAANSCRRTFRGVCFCALHGYMKNLAGFIFPHTT